MALQKHGSPTKIRVIKNAGFTISENFLAEMILKQIPSKKLTVDELHDALKSIGIVNYSSDDMNKLISRLRATGFTVLK